MPTVRYIDEVPNIVLHGKHDDKAERCSMMLMRNGKSFNITVNADDVPETQFHETWKSMFRSEPEEVGRLFVYERWDRLCDLVIAHCLDILQDLAPLAPGQTSLQDILHTPSYALKVSKDPEGVAVQASVVDGPVQSPAYGLQPTRTESVAHLMDVEPRYFAKDVAVVQSVENLRTGPRKVSTADGPVHYFQGFNKSTRDADTGQEEHPSQDAIQAYVRLHAMCAHGSSEYPPGVPRVTGVVFDGELVAGILLTWIATGRSIANQLEQCGTPQQLDDLEAKIPDWCTQTTTIVQALGERGFVSLDADDASVMDATSLLVDSGGLVWLPLLRSPVSVEEGASDIGTGQELQSTGAVKLFTESLPRGVEALEARLTTGGVGHQTGLPP